MPPKPRGRPTIHYYKHVIHCWSKVLVLRLVQIPLSRGGEENFQARQGSGAALPRRMSKRGNTALHKPSKSSTGRSIRRSWWPSTSWWTLQPRLLGLPKPKFRDLTICRRDIDRKICSKIWRGQKGVGTTWKRHFWASFARPVSDLLSDFR